MTNLNTTCINTLEGCVWGKESDFAEVNRVAKKEGDVKYLGNFMSYETSSVYAVFHTEKVNYLVEI